MGCGASTSKTASSPRDQGDGKKEPAYVPPPEDNTTGIVDESDDEPELTEEEKKIDEEKAAVRVQSLYRGFKARSSHAVAKAISSKPPFHKLLEALLPVKKKDVLSNALIFGRLSSLMYDVAKLSQESNEFELDSPAGPIKATRLTYKLQTPEVPCPQWAIFHIPTLKALCVAFRGTKTKVDAKVDADFIPGGSLGAKEYSVGSAKAKVLLHGGIITSLHKHVTGIMGELEKAQEHYPDSRIYTTGHSLGGGYAVSFVMMLLSIGKIAIDNVNIYTYGAPLVTALEKGETPETSGFESLDKEFQSKGIIHAFVNRFDIVPRLLGQHSHLSSITTGSQYAARLTKKKTPDTLSTADTFFPIGNYYAILHDEEGNAFIRQCNDNKTRDQFLHIKAKPAALSKSGGDHSMDSKSGYLSKLTTCISDIWDQL